MKDLIKYFVDLITIQNITNLYHLKTLNQDFVIHNYLGELYSDLSGKVDEIGEQIIILGGTLPSWDNVNKKTNIADIEGEDEDYIKDLIESLYNIKKYVNEIDVDRATNNLLDDHLLSLGKICAKLESLVEDED